MHGSMEVQAKAADFASPEDGKAEAQRSMKKLPPAYSSTNQPNPDPMGDVKSYIFDTQRDIGMTLNESSEIAGKFVVGGVTEGAQAAALGLVPGVVLVKIGTKMPPKDAESLAKVFKTLAKHRSKMQLQFSSGADSLFRRRPSFTLYQFDV